MLGSIGSPQPCVPDPEDPALQGMLVFREAVVGTKRREVEADHGEGLSVHLALPGTEAS